MTHVEKCIMPDNPPWWRNYEAVKTQRERYHRHEVFYGPNRKHSIEDGLVIFLTPNQHNMGNEGIHFNAEYDLYAKREAQRTWEQTYRSDRTESTRTAFIARYGKSYL